ncbi:Polygalacturonase precursor, putative [Ricinus communis]|uniref:Polygalacturonase, putative n=1 Tax=Ricinus communis TaxID=3988 RepID=B9SSX0_RICCO|nr:Polygalacturonase precursor, putative [Ricinus communis]|eukprot:XP_002529089.1 polygalacturonase [Ricinus communis]
MAKRQFSCSLLIAFLIFLFTSSLATAARFNVLNYGAKPDGRTDSTKAFLASWKQACGSIKPATVYVPSGRFFLKNVEFQGPCKSNAILFRIEGTLFAPSDYRVIGNAGYWLYFKHVSGVTVSGGILDGQGPGLWSCKSSGKNCPTGAASLGFSNSENIVISGVTSLNSQFFHMVINGCQNVKIQGVTVSASGNSPNTDGIHVQLSSGVTILNSRIRTGDDCISIGPGTINMWIEKIACGPGHGISIGSLGNDLKEPGVQNVTVKTVIFTGTTNGVRIKSWARPSSGFARNIIFQDVLMTNVQNPIVIDQNYCPDNNNCPGQQSGVKVSDIRYQDIHGTSATKVAVKFDCSKKNPCTKIKLQDVKLTYKNQPADASCNNADGTSSGFVQPSSCL